MDSDVDVVFTVRTLLSFSKSMLRETEFSLPKINCDIFFSNDVSFLENFAAETALSFQLFLDKSNHDDLLSFFFSSSY